MWTVKQMLMWNKTKETYTPLLSDYTADFWTEYKNNCNDYDDYFNTMFKSFVFFDQDLTDDIDDVTTAFTKTIKNYLRANDKRLSELWRINVVADDESYNIAENYYRVDTYTKTSDGQSSAISGQRTDINDTTTGEQSIRNNDNVTGFNSNDAKRRAQTENSIGSRNDISQFTQGRQQNTASTHGAESYTLTSHGAIGTMAVADLLTKNENYWAKTNIFYEFVFKEISEKFLLIGD